MARGVLRAADTGADHLLRAVHRRCRWMMNPLTPERS